MAAETFSCRCMYPYVFCMYCIHIYMSTHIYLYINIIYIWIISIVMNHFIAHWEVYSLVPPKHIRRHLTSIDQCRMRSNGCSAEIGTRTLASRGMRGHGCHGCHIFPSSVYQAQHPKASYSSYKWDDHSINRLTGL